MLMAAEKSTRIVVKNEISADWEALRERTGLSQQEVFDRLVRFLLAQDEVAQAMILRTLQPKPELVQYVLERMARDRPKAGGRTALVEGGSVTPVTTGRRR